MLESSTEHSAFVGMSSLPNSSWPLNNLSVTWHAQGTKASCVVGVGGWMCTEPQPLQVSETIIPFSHNQLTMIIKPLRCGGKCMQHQYWLQTCSCVRWQSERVSNRVIRFEPAWLILLQPEWKALPGDGGRLRQWQRVCGIPKVRRWQLREYLSRELWLLLSTRWCFRGHMQNWWAWIIDV